LLVSDWQQLAKFLKRGLVAMLNVLFVAPQEGEVPLQLQRQLALQGIHVQIASDPTSVCRESIDLVHFFSICDIDRIYSFAERAWQQGVSSVLTPNYWSQYEFLFETHLSLLQRTAKLIFSRLTAMSLFEKCVRTQNRLTWRKQKDLLQKCQFIWPNSEAEQAQLMDEYELDDAKHFSVVHGGVSASEIDRVSPTEFALQYGIRDFLLCVARFEDRNNQLGLIQALRRTDMPIVFMGTVSSCQQGYLQECQRAARKLNGRVLFIHECQSASMVYSAMKNARVHVTPSWWENTCLSGLNAALCGCNVLMTNRSPWLEYFGDAGRVCDPANQELLRQAVLHAYAVEKAPRLAEKIRSQFTEEKMEMNLVTKYSEIFAEKTIVAL
jgi:glycosyltransferase involved in cell wall biosynthesis